MLKSIRSISKHPDENVKKKRTLTEKVDPSTERERGKRREDGVPGWANDEVDKLFHI